MNNERHYNTRTARPRKKIRRKPRSSGGESGMSSFEQWLSPVTGRPDYVFMAIIGLLVVYGMIMLYSAGSARAYTNFGSSFHYMRNQLFGLIVGAGAMAFFSFFDYHRLGGKIAKMAYGFAGILLILVIAGLGTTVNGATRWLFGFQPSEIAKIAIIILFSYNLSTASGQKKIKDLKESFVPHILLLVIYIGLLLLEPHFSCAMLIGIIACVLLFTAGTPIKYFFGLLGLVIPFGIIAVIKEPYRLARIVNLNPFNDMQGGGWQVAQSLYAIGSGGVFGLGLGNSRQKYQSLPEPHNDFIYSVICEELGLIGAIIVIALFAVLLIRGIKIALKAPDLFGTLLCIGFVGIILVQAVFNIAVVTATLPNTGVPLPFFSYGSTALVINMAEMGIVLNVSRQSKL